MVASEMLSLVRKPRGGEAWKFLQQHFPRALVDLAGLFERRGRTYREKLRELANALRLERAYTKAEILEFYSNQFYVNGNGRGLGIAARFFFDAEVAELDLLQCAFLAGVVKSPNRYNPFVSDEKRRAKAISRAEERVEYVLRRMLEDDWICLLYTSDAADE